MWLWGSHFAPGLQLPLLQSTDSEEQWSGGVQWCQKLVCSKVGLWMPVEINVSYFLSSWRAEFAYKESPLNLQSRTLIQLQIQQLIHPLKITCHLDSKIKRRRSLLVVTILELCTFWVSWLVLLGFLSRQSITSCPGSCWNYSVLCQDESCLYVPLLFWNDMHCNVIYLSYDVMFWCVSLGMGPAWFLPIFSSKSRSSSQEFYGGVVVFSGTECKR